MEEKKLLEVDKLSIGFAKGEEWNTVVEEVSFSLTEGEILGIVGESGSGKSMTALAIMDLLPRDANILQGGICIDEKELFSLTKEQKRGLKGEVVSMIFQEPMTSLNPVQKVGRQVEEMLRLHEPKSNKSELYVRTIDMLKEVELKEAEKIYDQYPHQLSGGMRQRVMIAMAMICNPKLLIADEPTTALDASIQNQILNLIKRLSLERNMSIILISHDLNIIKKLCTRALVMKDGRIVEQGKVVDLFKEPKEEYTKKLLRSSLSSTLDKKEYSKDVVSSMYSSEQERKETTLALKVKELSTFYESTKSSIFRKYTKRQVLKDVSFQVKEGEILGIVGESGCGKSTLAKTIVSLITDKQGTIELYGNRPSMVFQDPYASLNPAKKIEWILEEPLKIIGGYSKLERKERILDMINKVGLKEKHLKRYVSELSGGQRQRVSIANALIGNSKLIILDEPVSALDVTVQEQILELLLKLQQELKLSYVFISHDLQVVRRICNRVCVMYQGEIVETAEVEELFLNPKQEYTKTLLSY